MTQANPPTSPTDDRRHARDVARHLDRRRIRRKLTLWTVLLAAVALAAMYATCGTGFGLGGGSGPGDVKGLTSTPQGPRRCAIRVTATGLTVAGKSMTRDEAVAVCKEAARADVVVTGDAREGDWKALYEALVTAGIKDISVHHPATGSGSN